MKETDIAYLAGFIDADGTISVHKDKSKYLPRVSMFNNNRAVLEWAQKLINKGGSISVKPAKKVNHQESYTLTWSYDAALFVSKLCIPYLIIKKRQAELLLEWKTITPRNGWYTEDLKVKKEKLILEIKILNARGRWASKKELYKAQLATIKSIETKAQYKKHYGGE